MIAQLNTTHQAEIVTEIVYSYVDFDGVTVDVVQMSYPNGTTETRQCWVNENLDGESTYFIKTAKGSVLNSSWKSTLNNKWLISYQQLWMQRWQAECDTHQANMDTLTHPEFYTPDEYAQAKADLGFGW